MCKNSDFEVAKAIIINKNFNLIILPIICLFISSFFIDIALVFCGVLLLTGALTLILSDIVTFFLVFGYSPLGIKYEEKDGELIKKNKK
ncbi:MAG: hypothetical protein US83_C0012G0038 [Candidatus Falkowbacteria bacterium GW2011_GWC2_38_22]|uniref:Uncharacterized protein n=1 Tax=Candidatus Falkowbacteria bacterium GW2011_GWE1_38_31 TaxID=1618638 RepID=A0A0G0JSX4_9BACT|nr:MAG: hypothetical protein US73_C0010G0038 [Candidatus Falkowbacteria bacterium GW2011_GWF2_38_1205]KKQ60799.1 MAG: hypothetical protein US83_C0012G0038 [Candidatus Falkowbacteria bacterium GW2011_GWC2_38_22]KKQ62966.1 MAG: hypothetical protein US84_C0010G0038 [Candidatus Falkowbacteria bacterium GW2011_GWF1_38_22]KKQ64978.1 MAG: hypothetical protein US87_C0010G0038 [Candidatus Falkowbacteria bacterium GW2011_GWE2_38_254]KKQ69742.1 MAG: hypothetical protein US91_C0010G0038 [Candidatus Falkowb